MSNTTTNNSVMKPKSILVIGGGLGGYAFARAMKIRDPSISVTIYERDSSAISRPQGFQIGLTQDGIGSLNTLELPHLLDLLTSEKIFQFALLSSRYSLLLNHGQDRSDFKDAAEIVRSRVNRWALHEMLQEGLDVEFSKRFVRYEEDAEKVTAFFDDGTQASGDLLVGADGARSKVRYQYCPSLKYHETGIQAIAGLLPLPDDLSFIPNLGKIISHTCTRVLQAGGTAVIYYRYTGNDGKHFLRWALSGASLKISDDTEKNRQICLASARASGDAEFEEIAKRSVRIDASRDVMSIAALKYVPPTTAARVTLLGDAAHAMTTHAGLGANTAFMDAVDLAKALNSSSDMRSAIKSYEEKMFIRGFQRITTSLRTTTMIHMSGWKASARNVVLWIIGSLTAIARAFGK